MSMFASLSTCINRARFPSTALLLMLLTSLSIAPPTATKAFETRLSIGLRHDLPTCDELFDDCIMALEDAGSDGNKDHRDDFDIWDFLYFVHVHSNYVIKEEVDEQLVDIYCMAAEALNHDVDDCNYYNYYQWPKMGIDLHDLFLFDGTELVKQMCREVQAIAEMECLPSVNFAFTTELSPGSDVDCVKQSLQTIIGDTMQDTITDTDTDEEHHDTHIDTDTAYEYNHTHFTVSVKVDEYECMKPVNDGNKCAFITNTIGAVGIDEDAQEKEKLRDTIETLINDNEEVIDILKGGGCFPSDVPSLAPTVTGWWWKKYYPEYY